MSGQIQRETHFAVAARPQAKVSTPSIGASPAGEIPGHASFDTPRASAGSQQSQRHANSNAPSTAGNNSADHRNTDSHGADVSGEGGAKPDTAPVEGTPHPLEISGHAIGATQERLAGDGEAVHGKTDTLHRCDRFSDPLIAQCVETWRQRQDMVRAMQRLTLQAKAICRRFTEGDKKEADKLWRSINNGMGHPMAEQAAVAIAPLLIARKPLEDARKAFEKTLDKLGKQLPIAHLADEIKGVNYRTLATIAAEIGDMRAYEKGVAGIWKRAGLAVIDGERQRKKADADKAVMHGYSPSRHAVFWNIADALLKSQGKEENAGPYRLIYDERKAYERPRVDSDGHAHNRALRFMVKRLLKDIWRAWREAQ